MNDSYKKFKDFDKQIMLFLYLDVGMLWEKYISKDEKCASKKKNKKLNKFFQDDSLINYNVTNAKDIAKKKVEIDEIFFTDSGKNVVSSLMKHLRNSIMHGEYEILNDNDGIYISFRDRHQKKKITMNGKIKLNTLKKLINCFK